MSTPVATPQPTPKPAPQPLSKPSPRAVSRRAPSPLTMPGAPVVVLGGEHLAVGQTVYIPVIVRATGRPGQTRVLVESGAEPLPGCRGGPQPPVSMPRFLLVEPELLTTHTPTPTTQAALAMEGSR